MGSATFWAFLSLVCFILIAIKMKAPSMAASILDNRAKAIEDELDQARRLREEAQALLAEYQRKQREAENEAEEIITLAKREAETMEKEAQAKIADFVTRRTQQAENSIAQAEKVALAEVKQAASDLAFKAAEQVLKDEMEGDVGTKLLKRSISEVGAKLS